MAHEITPWINPDCDLSVEVDSLTSRETFSREINERFGEGGGLNANYRTVEAVAIVVDILASNSLRYGVHFVFKTGSDKLIWLDFRDEATKEWGRKVLLGNGVSFRRQERIVN